MRIWRIVALVLALCSARALAGELADFNVAVEAASAHNRAALGYLHSGNADLASLALDRLRQSWRGLSERYAGKPPDAFAGNVLYGPLFTTVNARLVAADLMLHSGRPDATAQSLDGLRGDLTALRKASGVTVLADCVRDATTAIEPLLAYDDRALDWSQSPTRDGIASSAALYRHELERCDAMASEAVRANPDFRRPIDGAKAALALIPKAVATRDGDLLHRILSELRAVDNVLGLKFG